MKKYSLHYAKIVFSIVCFFVFQLSSAQWPQWRGQLKDGASSETNLLKEWPPYGPKLIWTSDTLGEGFSSAIIQDKIIYTTGKRDSVEIMSAFDFTGKLLWQKVFGKALKKGDWPESRSTPTLYNGKLYATTVAGDIACVDSKTGAIDWKINILEKFEGVSNYNGFGESPLVADDKVILSPCGIKTTLIALNRLTGETIWTSESVRDTNQYVSPILIQDKEKKIIITSANKNILAFDFMTGKIIWKYKTSTNVVPLPYNKQVYFSAYNGGKMLSLNDDMNNITVLWSDTAKSNFMGGPVRLGDRIYCTMGQGKGLFCIDWKTGKILSVNKEINGANLLVADGMIYGYEERSGRVFLIKPNGDNTDLVSSFKIKTGKGPNLAHLSIADGTLFIRHGKYLMAYDVKQL
jgi:outer membrane protein assembly factor BamB